MTLETPRTIPTVEDLERLLAEPYPELVEMMAALPGDLMILGAAGKMGPTLARLALEAARRAGVDKRVVGVSRYSDPAVRAALDDLGVETISCDLHDPNRVAALPRASNIIYMAGRKFGQMGSEGLTWLSNVVAPANVARTFTDAKIVVFSTGCVYDLASCDGLGSKETDPPNPVGEYSYSCLGRERVFEYFSELNQTPTLIYRLNYAIDLRYGVLVDIARNVLAGRPVDLSVGSVNVIWQGDANNRALLCLNHAASPPVILNVTGGERLSVRWLAEEFARAFGRQAMFCGTDSGKAYLSDAGRSIELFGPPRVKVERMIEWIAAWLQRGGETLDKPTHFNVTDGQFLD